MDRKILNKTLAFAGIIVLFLIISYGFVPEVLGGKIVNQADISGWTGMTKEVTDYNEANPQDKSMWTNSMFGGMPTISMYGDFRGDWTNAVYELLLTGERPATYLFVSLLGAFLMMLAFGMSPLLAIGGAIAVTFCSYNMQIIQVGHNTKMQAIAYMPWVLAAMAFTYNSVLNSSEDRKRKYLKTLLGAVLFGFALSFQIKANHPQISYYLAIVIFVYVITLVVKILRSPEKGRLFKDFISASALLLVLGCAGIATNANKLIPTYEYAEHSMRGGTELGKGEGETSKAGLDLDYATAWSYGIEETPNLLIPNFNGGSSAGDPGLRESSVRNLLVRAQQPDIDNIMKALPLYWGPQPFTAGPMYLGAISVFLFILGTMLVKGKEKWWLIVCTILAIFLAWGSHFIWFTKLWFDLAPLYNKFRTVSMALVILQVTVPLLGFLAMKKITEKADDRKSVTRAAWTAYAVTGGICLLFAFFPSLAGSFSSSADSGMQEILADALQDDRRAMMVNDAYRSFFLTTLAFALILWLCRTNDEKVYRKRTVAACCTLAVLILFDLGGVDKRYLNKSHFVTRQDFSGQFEARPVDRIILEDKSPDYRVLDLSVNTFNDAHPSYWHKCIGGYNPAKLQRYQDLVERYITGEINAVYRSTGSAGTIEEIENRLPYLPVISMLNGKYIILDGNYPPVTNRNAFGNCWIADSLVAAGSPDEEIAMLGSTDLKNTAIVGKDFKHILEQYNAGMKSENPESAGDTVKMLSYNVKELRYSCSLSDERAVVFSEIYYPEGWKAWIEPSGKYGEVRDGNYVPTSEAKEIELFRADWILRAAMLPEGEYDLIMRFEPESYKIGERISRASSMTLFLLLALTLAAAGFIRYGKPRRM